MVKYGLSKVKNLETREFHRQKGNNDQRRGGDINNIGG